MADNIELNAASGGAVIATDEIGAVHHQIIKLAFGALDGMTLVTAATGLPVAGGAAHDSGVSGAPVLIGAEAKDFDGEALPNAVNAEGDAVRLAASLAGVQYVMLVNEDGSAAGTVTVQDGGGSITVDVSGTVTVDGSGATQPVSNAGLTELASAINGNEVDVDIKASDLDLMLGTDFSSVLGTASLVLTTQADDVSNASDGLQVSAFGYVFDGTAWDRLRGTSADGLLVDLGTNNDVTVSGTVTANLSATDNAVLDSIDTDLDTIIGHVDGLEAALAAIDADTGGILTAVQLLRDAVYVDDADWTDDTSKHLLVGGLYQSTPQTITDGDVGPFQVDEHGFLRVVVESGGGGGGGGTEYTEGDTDASITGAAVLAEGPAETLTPLLVDGSQHLQVDIAASSATVTVSGTVTANAGTNLNTSTLALESGGNLAAAATSLALIDDAVIADDAAFTPGTTKVVMAGFEADESSTDSVNEGDGGAARMTLDRKQIVAQYAHAAGGCKYFSSVDLDESEEQVASGPCTVYSMYAWNLTATPLWLQVFNATAASIAPGSDAPAVNMMIPANADSDGAGIVIPVPAAGLEFTTALTVAVTTGSGTNSGAPSTGAAGIFIGYKD